MQELWPSDVPGFLRVDGLGITARPDFVTVCKRAARKIQRRNDMMNQSARFVFPVFFPSFPFLISDERSEEGQTTSVWYLSSVLDRGGWTGLNANSYRYLQRSVSGMR